MNRNINIALVALFALGAVSASAETNLTTSADVSITTTSMSPTTGAVGLPPKPPLPGAGVLPGATNTHAEMEAREKALRQTQQSTFGDRAKAFRATTTEMSKEMRGEMKDNREEMEKRAKEMRESSRVERKDMKDEQKKERLEKASKKMEVVDKRLDAAIARVQKLSDRVSERLTKFEAEGVNVTVSRGHLAEAKVKLDEARTKAATVRLSIETALASGVSSTTPSAERKDVMKNVQEAVKGAAKIIQEAQRHVALAISSAKPGLNKPRPATTTPVTTSGATSVTTATSASAQ